MTDTIQTKWYQKTWAIVLFLFLFFPVGLFLMWKYASWNKVVKGVITGVFVLLVISMNGSDNRTTPTSSETAQVAETSGESKPAEAAKPKIEEKQETIYTLSQPIQGKTLEVSLTSVEERNSVGGQYFNEKASEGGVLVAIDFQYKNISDKPVKSYSKPEVKLIDANGTEYGSDLGKTSSYATEVKLDSKVWSDLNPGIQVKDAEVFEVSKESFNQDTWFAQVKLDGKKYKVALK